MSLHITHIEVCRADYQYHDDGAREVYPIIDICAALHEESSRALFKLLHVSLELPLIVIDGVETSRNSLLARILNNKPVITK